MRNNYLKMLTFGAAMLLIGGHSLAQTTQADADPMTYAKSLHTENLTPKARVRQSSTSNSADYFTYNYGSETSVPTKIAAKLAAKYGPAKTGRGDLKVWEVKNASQHQVTIMIGSNKAGEQEFIIDQRKPALYTRQSRQAPVRARSSARPAPRARPSSQERD